MKKHRQQEQLFVVEGAKSVTELLNSDFHIELIAGTSDYLQTITAPSALLAEVKSEDLESIGMFQSNESALAVARMKPNEPIKPSTGEFILALDDVRDPGNLGTIIRTADWFGIKRIVASNETADLYNSKVISSTMGSFTRVKMFYTDLAEYLPTVPLKLYGAFLAGEDVHRTDFTGGGVIVIGNEARGISPAVSKLITNKITIPRYGEAESLNAAIATAVICDNVCRLVQKKPLL
ncbi:MAG: RNA methyltransferase [Chryseolinea sp.]